jgi:hypothetical protein
MTFGFIVRIFICIFTFSLLLYLFIVRQNELTQLKIAIPALNKKVEKVQREVALLRYEKERFENPAHLMQLIEQPEFGHLKHPLIKDIVIVPEVKVDDQYP